LKEYHGNGNILKVLTTKSTQGDITISMKGKHNKRSSRISPRKVQISKGAKKLVALSTGDLSIAPLNYGYGAILLEDSIFQMPAPDLDNLFLA